MTDLNSYIVRLQDEMSGALRQPVVLTSPGSAPLPEGPILSMEFDSHQVAIAVAFPELRSLMAAAGFLDEQQATPKQIGEIWREVAVAAAQGAGGRAEGVAAGANAGEVFVLRRAEAGVRRGVSVQRPAETWAADSGNYDLLLEVQLDAMVRFGTREMELGDILDLGAGDVVELDRRITDPVDLVVGEKIVARGEVVLVNGNFGLRVTEVAEPMRRLESIRWL